MWEFVRSVFPKVNFFFLAVRIWVNLSPNVTNPELNGTEVTSSLELEEIFTQITMKRSGRGESGRRGNPACHKVEITRNSEC